jgi:hypothetical protein
MKTGNSLLCLKESVTGLISESKKASPRSHDQFLQYRSYLTLPLHQDTPSDGFRPSDLGTKFWKHLFYRQCEFYVPPLSVSSALTSYVKVSKLKSKAVPITGPGGLQGCEILRIPHCLDNRLTDGGKVVSPTHRLHFTLHKHFSASGTHFYYKLSEPQA